MKRDIYLTLLEHVTTKATTKWDIEKMRDAMTQAKINLERRYEAIIRDDFKVRQGK